MTGFDTAVRSTVGGCRAANAVGRVRCHGPRLARCDSLAAAMDRVIAANGLDFAALMATDPVRGNSELLFRGIESVRRTLPYRRGERGVLLMPGVLSRKKQLLPEIIAALS